MRVYDYIPLMIPVNAGDIRYYVGKSNLDFNSPGEVAVDFLPANGGVCANLKVVSLSSLETALCEGHSSRLGDGAGLSELTLCGGSHEYLIAVRAGGLAPCDLCRAALCLLCGYLRGSGRRRLYGYDFAVLGDGLLALCVNIACDFVVVGLALGQSLVCESVRCGAADVLECTGLGSGAVHIVAGNVLRSGPGEFSGGRGLCCRS